jgi:hypothetical protein
MVWQVSTLAAWPQEAPPAEEHRYAAAGLVAFFAAEPRARAALMHARLPEALVAALSTADR